MSMSGQSASQRNIRRLVALGATVTVIGIAFSASGGQELGSFIGVGGVLLSIYALHRFGRTGPD
jgi:hypothetical protein